MSALIIPFTQSLPVPRIEIPAPERWGRCWRGASFRPRRQPISTPIRTVTPPKAT